MNIFSVIINVKKETVISVMENHNNSTSLSTFLAVLFYQYNTYSLLAIILDQIISLDVLPELPIS